MFTGIVEEVGKITIIKLQHKSCVLTIEGRLIFDDIKLGDSIAVNGVCLTVSDISNKTFIADVMSETLSRSSLGTLKVGSLVNLERSMPVYGRFGGHIVSGHIDGTGSIVSINKEDNAVWYTIKSEKNLMKYIVEKGSITVDGISLTVANITRDSFNISIIPHTAKNTTLLVKTVGDIVNLENDIISKYVEKLLGSEITLKQQSNITKEMLLKSGY